MQKVFRSILILAALSGATAVAQPAEDIEIECTAAGYDVLLRNLTRETLQIGDRILWEVRFVRHSGVFVLEKVLEPNEGVFVSGAVGSDYLSSPQPCVATHE